MKVTLEDGREVEVRFDCHHDQGVCDDSCRLSARQLVLRQWREELAATGVAIDEARIARLRARHAQLQREIATLETSGIRAEFVSALGFPPSWARNGGSQ